MTTSETRLPPPPPTTTHWGRLMLGFGVSVAAGLAPLLGTLRVPGFEALLNLFPTLPWNTQKSVIPLAAFAMGVTAVVIQLRTADSVTAARLKKLFRRTLVAIIVCFAILSIGHTMLVRQVRIPAVNDETAVLVGFFRPAACTPCSASMSDSECISKHLSFSPERIQSCWGDANLRVAFLLMLFAYVSLMCGFGSLVGYVMVKQSAGGASGRSRRNDDALPQPGAD
jgi:hypothetical protein